MRNQKGILQNTDWLLVTIFIIMVLMGWLNIYAAVFDDDHQSIFDLTQNYGKQTLWIAGAFFIAMMILVIDGKFYAAFSYPIYGLIILLCLSTFIFARDVKGSFGWIDIGSFKLQPAEFAKFATNMALAKYLSTLGIRMKETKTKMISAIILGLPAIIICLVEDH